MVAVIEMSEYVWTVETLQQQADQLRAGDSVSLSGRIYTARDAAHKRLMQALDEGRELPFDMKGAVIYYAGPTPTPPGRAIGSCGPTTSSRMDPFAPRLYDLGMIATVGKGGRNAAVCEAIRRNGGVYLCAIGGAGALISRCVTSCRVIAYDDLGCESVKELIVKDLPLTVAIDAVGGNLFA